ncbi:MAG: gamma-glutamyltransferase [Gammaproteobacteria bacterium]|nr:gamma-glutamyltransferase [Gammaproteobacteria bacterium]MBT8093776.1 gamma-glutamyltransferase [Gammaproteobacteria bacterium]NNF48416.1 gamma-glutamyltransferase [Woeseiaceae bacterium]NNL62749.1 gamma-glutamyltransferase [Woeseiaceae bacterium]
MKRITCLIFGAFLLAGSMSAVAEPGYDRVAGRAHASRSEVIASHGMVATSQPLATQVGLDILKAGGSAVDAAIAANAALGLMEPTGSGIGGDLFAIVWDAEKEALAGLNASGRAPRAMTLDYFRERGIDAIPKFGPLPVSVPGAVDGWFELHDRYGRLPMTDVLAPAIRYAREGFPVSEVIARYFRSNRDRIGHYPGFADVYMQGGDVPRKGDVFRNPRLADTYEAIANKGRDEFYKGDIARAIDTYMAEQGGLLRYEDLAAHTSEWVTPVSTNYRGWEVYELPPNGQGIAALQILNILEGYDIAAMGFGSADYVHLLVEAKKLAFADRARYYADPDFADVPVDWLVSKEYAAERRKLISPERAAQTVPAGERKLEEGDTIYLTVADAAGNMVSLIQSNYRGMGSGMTPPELGFVLQNRAELFALDEGHANVVAGGKRPFHTIIPAFVMKAGRPLMSFGVMGGAMQPQGHAQIIVNMLDFGMNLQEAGDAARINHKGSSQPTGTTMTDGGVVHLERGFEDALREELQRRGHRLGPSDGGFGGYQAIMFEAGQGVYYGASEPRKDGQAAGY